MIFNEVMMVRRTIFTIAMLTFWLVGAESRNACAAEKDFNYLIGRASTDITGPAVGVQMFGFVRADQITEGIHLRQRARTFIVAEPDSRRRLVIATLDMGSVTHEITRSVIERLRERYGDLYGLDNVIIAATHTHAGPAGFWHYGADTPLGGPFYREFFDAIVDGVTASIVAAHDDLRPGEILINAGQLDHAGAQRSAPAYKNNPEQERRRYDADTDKQMTLLKFVRDDGAVGTLNWFAVHPTSMTYYNRLISGDNKGYAEYAFERSRRDAGDRAFVAAFAQTNCGDVTANLNLDNTGPGKDDFESTRIIGERQFKKALELFQSAETALAGPIDYRQQYVDFSSLAIDEKFTGAGPRHGCPSAYGYSFAAGSTEDGGGHPLFKEGMTKRNPIIDDLARKLVPLPPPSDELRACQAPKAILIAPGAAKPPAQAQVQPLGIARIGPLVLVVGPVEFTTMTGRRIRERVASILGVDVRYVVMAGYANGYIGYLTTHEEYETQQYEGGHTLFGPWEEAGFRQQYAQLAQALAAGKPVESSVQPRDIRPDVQSTPLSTDYDQDPPGAKFGDVVKEAKAAYHQGDQVVVSFWTGNPRNGYRRGDNFLSVQHRAGDGWEPHATDADWSTKCRFKQPAAKDAKHGDEKKARPKKSSAIPMAPGPMTLDAHQITITWDIPSQTESGTYRIVHFGRFKSREDGQVHTFKAASQNFTVQ